MGHYRTVRVPPDFGAWHKEDQVGGRYRVFVPDPLPMSNPLDPEVYELLTQAVAAVSKAAAKLTARPLQSLYATLLKSESIASSNIEGLRAQPRDVLAANLDLDAGATAAQIAANIDSMRLTVTSLAENREWTDADVDAVHKALLPGMPRGYRDKQVWIGGRSVFRASYVAPAPDAVPGLMSNLLAYANGSRDHDLVTAGLVHAQFETIHPYEDGNGRTGRALIHGILARSGTISGGVLPVSSILKTQTDEYVAALTAFRYEGSSPGVRRLALSSYLLTYLDATIDAASLVVALHSRAEAIEERWRGLVSSRFRSDSTVHRILPILLEQPVVTVPYLGKRIDATPPALYNSVTELVRIGILSPPRGKYRKAEAYCADELVDMLLLTERSLSSPLLDTVKAQPARPVPQLPERLGPKVQCGKVLPRLRIPCNLNAGHLGRCRRIGPSGAEANQGSHA